jgi:hypothetical protein
MKHLKLKAYHPRLLQGILNDDPEWRLRFCATMLDQMKDQPNLLDTIVWSRLSSQGA